MKQKQKAIFVVEYMDAIYLGHNFQMSMLPTKVIKNKSIYIEQIKHNNYYPTNSVCRETMISNIEKELFNIPRKRTISMLVIIPNKSKGNLDKGIKLVNHYEKLLNWNKTYTYNVNRVPKVGKDQKLNNNYKKFSFVLVTIPNKWLYSPQLTSLYLMLLKIAEIGFECKFKTHKELIDQLNTFFIKKPDNLNHFLDGFYYKAKNSYKYWDVFLCNLNFLFKNRTRKFNYNIDKKLGKLYKKYNHNHDCFIYLDGIDNLVMGKSYDKRLRKNFDDLLVKTTNLQKVLLK